MSEPKFENRPLERLKLENFGTLREIFSKNLARFSPNLARFWPNFGQNFRKLWPFEKEIFDFRDFGILLETTLWISDPLRDFWGIKGHPYGSHIPALPKYPPGFFHKLANQLSMVLKVFPVSLSKNGYLFAPQAKIFSLNIVQEISKRF